MIASTLSDCIFMDKLISTVCLLCLLHVLLGLGFPIIVIPWVVLQEMDSLKMGRGLSGSVAHLATPAISYIYKCLKSREPRLWGQSMQQAAESSSEWKLCLYYTSISPCESCLIGCWVNC